MGSVKLKRPSQSAIPGEKVADGFWEGSDYLFFAKAPGTLFSYVFTGNPQFSNKKM
jgi:hypothetical protein